MLLEYLLFVGYLILFAWLVTKTRFFITSDFSKSQLVILFLLKTIIAIFYGWMGNFYGGLAQMLDTWSFHHYGMQEYRLLGTDPKEYFTNLFHNPYENGVQNFFGSSDSYWNDLKGNIFRKFLSVFDIFSLGHYYINVIFYSFVTLFAPMAVYKVMIDIFPGKRIAVVLAVFFIPSFFYWSSGIGKEGLIFLGISFIIYHTYFAAKEKRLAVKRIAGILLGLLILLVLRNFLLVIITPALLTWMLAKRFPRYSLICFTAVYTFFAILFFTLRYLDSRLDFPKAVVEKQQAFIQMKGNSSIPIRELQPNAISFLVNTPQALTLSAARPYPGDIKHILSLAAAIETGLLWILFLLFLFFREKNTIIRSKDTIHFFVFFSFSLLMAIGFSVNNLGAIVRYRSVIIPLLVPLLLAQIDWNRIRSFSMNIRK